jgi:hypothetical protein
MMLSLAETCSRRVEVTGPRGADGSLRANRFGSVATKYEATDVVAMSPRRTAYVVTLPPRPWRAAEHLAVGLEHLALDWLDADAAPREARLAGRQQRLVEQTADGELVARLLAEPGVDPNAAASVSDGHGDVDPYTPLTRAAELGHLEALRLLLEAGADPSLADGDGITPLMVAAAHGQLEVVRLLLARGAAVDAVDPGDGGTAFHLACFNNQPDCVEELARAGCDVGLKDKNGHTGREMAEGEGHAAVVERLRAVVGEQLRAAQAAVGPGPDEPEPAAVVGDGGPAAQLLNAVREGEGAAVARLLAAGADPNDSVAGRMASG